MKLIGGVIAAFVALASPAKADGFRDREVAFQVLNAVDTAQTCYIVGSGRGVEANPLFGARPKCAKLIAIKAGAGLAHYLIANELQKSNEGSAKFFQVFTIAIYGTVVAANFRLVF